MLKRKIFLAILVSGCASSKPPTATTRPDRVIATDETTGSTIRSLNEPGAAPVVLRAPQDSVWRAVALTYLFLKVPVSFDDKSIGEQGNKMFVMSRSFDGQPVSHYLNCGDDLFRGPNADSQRVTASLITRTRAVSATQTSIEIFFSGYIAKPGQSGTLYCTSTGSLELHMAEMVASRIPQK